MVRFLQKVFSAPPHPRSWGAVIGWWERRRLFFSVFIAVVGALSLGVAVLLGRALPIAWARLDIGVAEPGITVPFLAGLVFLLLCANFFYTAGWVVEATVSIFWPHRSIGMGPPLLAGIMLVCLFGVLLPPFAVVALWFARMIT